MRHSNSPSGPRVPATLLLTLCSLAGLAGCSGKPPTIDPDIGNYVIAVDGDGRAVNPLLTDSTPDAGTPSQKASVERREWSFDRQMSDMLAAMNAWHDRPDVAATGKRKILIFAHGGLSQPEGSLVGAMRDFRDITALPPPEGTGSTKEEDRGYYPIFINWDSGFISSYGEHLVHVRRGRKDRKDVFVGPAAAPLQFLTDLARAVSRAPLVWLYQIDRDVQSAASSQLVLAAQGKRGNAWLRHPRLRGAKELYDTLRDRYEANPKTEINISIGGERASRWQAAARVFTYALTLPLKLLTSPIIDGGGTPAWDNMSRRTLMMFEGAELDRPGRNPQDAMRHTPGAVQQFAEQLAEHLQRRSEAGGPCYELTVVGHSMGSMVVNEFIRRNPDLPYRNVVYMGAACTIRDFAKSVVPLLERKKEVRFYNLCLHPGAELRETNYGDVPPRGSLLVWIDDFFANPSTPLDRTLGRWENIVDSTYVIPEGVRGQVAIKAFDLKVDFEPPRRAPRDGTWTPQMHGQFRWATRYWESGYWRPRPLEDADEAEIRASGQASKDEREQQGAQEQQQQQQQQQ